MESVNPFKDVVKEYTDEQVLNIINDRENFSANLHAACIDEAKNRSISLDEVDLENLLPYSEIEKLKEIKHELSIGLTDENVINYLVVSGYTLEEAERKVNLAKRIKYEPTIVTTEEEAEPNYTMRFFSVIRGMVTVVLILVLLFQWWRRFFGN